MVSAAQKTKKSLSAWSLATKLTGSHISLSNKQKKPSAEETQGKIMCLLFVPCSFVIMHDAVSVRDQIINIRDGSF